MNRMILPSWLSVLSLAVALFVPMGVSLIADTSVDTGNLRNIASEANKRVMPAEARGGAPLEQRKFGYLDSRV